MRVQKFLACAFVFAFVGSTISLGQATLGVIAGSVSDSSGAVVVGASVSVSGPKAANRKLLQPAPRATIGWKR